ncbi:MAG: DUF1269 domain-containing protein [Labilithrix sp.]|nr:DUF1269 domain-containing protein [Labilithrix sp.]
MSQTEPNHLLVIAFDSPLKSREAFLAFQRLQTEQGILLHDAVFLDKTAEGRSNVTETVDVQPAESAARSGLWGALIGTLVAGPVGTVVGGALSAGIGALTAKLVDIGIPDATVKELEASLSPGTSALALLVSHVKDDALERELARFAGAKLTQSSLTPDTVQRLRNALGSGSAGSGSPA